MNEREENRFGKVFIIALIACMSCPIVAYVVYWTMEVAGKK